ncbi:MAG: cob(I)yrinic acid a,c-diamide adenosyltransferase [Candidatus Hydrogenedentota bacterium]|nr:MAG: cob(I)yrinic acid a,c-diamide adenosyltransferase [Candidatus Hydrogenedentota bacterium]
MKINRVYTRAGDDGTTALLGGGRVPKDSVRVEAYGTLDELQSILGLLRAELRGIVESGGQDSAFATGVLNDLHALQNDLFDIGRRLSIFGGNSEAGAEPFDEKRVRFLEYRIDEGTADLPELRSFILSGGGRFSALAHFARTVSRRAERIVVALARSEPVSSVTLAYLNRLSDYLFVLARRLAAHFGESEPLWETPLKKESQQEDTSPPPQVEGEGGTPAGK